MSGSRVNLASYQPAVDRAVSHLLEGHDTVLVAARGCGLTTLRSQIAVEIRQRGADVVLLDINDLLRAALGMAEGRSAVWEGAIFGPDNLRQAIERLIVAASSAGSANIKAIIVDHAATCDPHVLRQVPDAIYGSAPEANWSILWLGPFDVRSLVEEHGVRLHSVPRTHVCLPALARDDALAAYRAIAENHHCRWGDAVLFLLLDLCGNDLALATSIAEYLHGNWTEKLYDDSVWDRVGDWLANDDLVSAYRQRLQALDDDCKRYLSLLRLGGKPPCHREDLLEEPEAALRKLLLAGIVIPNLLPGFYQLRNLTVRYLIDEHFSVESKAVPESLFRRATNERVGHLLQDAEMMLRAVLRSAFAGMSEAEVQTMLAAKQGDAELLPAGLNRALLDWAGKQESADLRESLNAILVEHRKEFKLQNSVWTRVERLMKEDADEGAGQLPVQERAVDYLTFNELGDFVIELLGRTLPGPYRAPTRLESVKERWRDSLSKIRRLRNRVAHHRNIEFQDMEDLAGCIESMRRDLYNHGAWR